MVLIPPTVRNSNILMTHFSLFGVEIIITVPKILATDISMLGDGETQMRGKGMWRGGG